MSKKITKTFHFALNIETIVFCTIIVLALISRFYSLGARVMSHDESLHAYYSWNLYKGNGYHHNPMMHGPLQFYLVAFSFFLFGDNDFTARLPHAIASVVTIIMLWKWRRYLGRPGALIAAGFMVISPYLLYYGRYARNEAFIALFGILTLYAVLRYLESGKVRFLYLLIGVAALHFTTKETSYIYSAQVLLFVTFIFIQRVIRQPWEISIFYRLFLAMLIIGILFLSAAVGLAFYDRIQPGLELTRTATPLIPQQSLTKFTSEGIPIPLSTLLSIGAILACATAGAILIRGYGVERIRNELSFNVMILLGTLILPQTTSFLVNLIGRSSITYGFSWPGWDLKALLNSNMIVTILCLVLLLTMSIALGLWWNKKLWIKNAAIFFGIFIFFYTTFFTYWPGLFTGMIDSLGYWIVQHGVQRGSQPWYYYLLVQIPIYEFLPSLGLLLAIYFRLIRKSPSLDSSATHSLIEKKTLFFESAINGKGVSQQSTEGNYTFSLLFWWSVSSMMVYTIAGEKMPWLTVHITLPIILLSGWALGKLVEIIDWKYFIQRKGIQLSLLIILFYSSLFLAINIIFGPTPPFRGKDLISLQSSALLSFSLLITVGSLIGLRFISIGWKMNQVIQITVLIFFSMLVVLTARSAIRAAYIHPNDATEYLVYAHGSSGVKDIMRQIDTISELTEGNHKLIVAYDASAPDSGVSWPFTWYLRNYPYARSFDQPTIDLQEASVIIVDDRNFDSVLSITDDLFYHFTYQRMVWPNQDYFNLTINKIISNIKNPGILKAVYQIWLNRDYTFFANVTGETTLTLDSWSPADLMHFFIRKDLAAHIWEYGIATSLPEQTDPYSQGMTTIAADLTFGTLGQTEGQFNAPRGLAVASNGVVYVADSRNNRIQYFSSDGQYIGSWGTFADSAQKSAPLGTFNEPWGVAVSPDGQWVYVADTWNHRIQKFTAVGIPINSWGYANFGQDNDPFGFWGPRGITVDTFGHVYVSDTGNKRIAIFDEYGNFLSQVGIGGMNSGQFEEPVGLALDTRGYLYVADTWNQRIQVFSPSANGTSFVPFTQWDIAGWYGQSLDNKPFLAVDQQAYVFVTDPELSRILEFTSMGNFVRTWGSSGSGPENFGVVSGIAIDGQRRIWVSDSSNNRLILFSIPDDIVEEGLNSTIPTEVLSP